LLKSVRSPAAMVMSRPGAPSRHGYVDSGVSLKPESDPLGLSAEKRLNSMREGGREKIRMLGGRSSLDNRFRDE
jgi:hypothetical protein